MTTLYSNTFKNTGVSVFLELTSVKHIPSKWQKYSESKSLDLLPPNIKHKVEELSALEDNWDGYGALPLHHEVLERYLHICLSFDVHSFNVFPSPDGGLLLISEQRNVFMIKIANDSFSYSIFDKQYLRVKEEHKLDFSIQHLRNAFDKFYDFNKRDIR